MFCAHIVVMKTIGFLAPKQVPARARGVKLLIGSDIIKFLPPIPLSQLAPSRLVGGAAKFFP